MTPEQEFQRVVALAGLRPENVTAVVASVVARQIEQLLKRYTPEAAAFYLRTYFGVGVSR